MNDFMKHFNSNDIQEINNFLNSAQGKRAAKGLNNIDKADILNRFMQLDPNLVKSKLNGLTKEDILKLLK